MNRTIELRYDSQDFTLTRVCEILEGTIISGADRAEECVNSACGSDLMSDVLAFAKPGSMLLTGLANPQVVRTAEMLDIKAVVLVRDKRPDDKTVQMARAINLVLITSPFALYESCGRLYQAGLSPAHVSRETPGSQLTKAGQTQARADQEPEPLSG